MFIHHLSIGSLNDDFASSVFHVSFTSMEIHFKYNRSAQESWEHIKQAGMFSFMVVAKASWRAVLLSDVEWIITVFTCPTFLLTDYVSFQQSPLLEIAHV